MKSPISLAPSPMLVVLLRPRRPAAPDPQQRRLLLFMRAHTWALPQDMATGYMSDPSWTALRERTEGWAEFPIGFVLP
jgi:hypothetical protein